MTGRSRTAARTSSRKAWRLAGRGARGPARRGPSASTSPFRTRHGGPVRSAISRGPPLARTSGQATRTGIGTLGRRRASRHLPGNEPVLGNEPGMSPRRCEHRLHLTLAIGKRGASPPAPGADMPGTPDPRGAIAIWVLCLGFAAVYKTVHALLVSYSSRVSPAAVLSDLA